MRRTFASALLLITLVAVSTRTASTAAPPWTTIYDRPSNAISSITMFDDRVGLALTSPGVLRTEDGGRIWTEAAAQPRIATGAIAFADARVAWAVTYSGGIWRTDDGGATWQRQPSRTDTHLQSIAVVSAREAWVTGRGQGFSDVGSPVHEPSVLLHTIDAGASWTSVAVPGFGTFTSVTGVATGTRWLSASPCHPGEPFFDSPGGPPVCHDTSTLLRSSDDGATWKTVAAAPAVVPDGPRFFNDHDGIGTTRACNDAGCTLTLYATTDGGATWTKRGPVPGTASLIPQFRDAMHGATSIIECDPENRCTHRLTRTADGGKTWTSEPAVFVASFPTFAASFAVTSDAVLVSGGTTGIGRYDLATRQWAESVTGAVPQIYPVGFMSDEIGYALSPDVFLRTGDGGATWEPAPSPPSRLQSVVLSLDRAALWATPFCSDICSDLVYRSVDRGQTWEPRTLPHANNGTIVAADRSRAWIILEDGLWRTDDGGLTWNLIDPSSRTPTPTFLDHDHAWTDGCGPSSCQYSIRVTSDGGSTWERRQLPENASRPYFLSAQLGWTTSYDFRLGPGNDNKDQIWRTIDGGVTWDSVGTSDLALNSLFFINSSTGWAIGGVRDAPPNGPYPPPVLLRTDDGGASWRTEVTLEGNGNVQFFRSDRHVWLSTSVSDNPYGSGRTVILRTDVAGGRPIAPPDAGTGTPHAANAFALTASLLAIAGVATLAAATTLRRTRRQTT